MTYNLSDLAFVNDFAFIDKENGCTIAFNQLDEQIELNGEEVDINIVNVVTIDNNGNQFNTTNIIGMTSDEYTIVTDYSEYLGQQLTKDNIKYCKLEVSDD